MLLRRVHEIISLLNGPFSHMTLRTVFHSAQELSLPAEQGAQV